MLIGVLPLRAGVALLLELRDVDLIQFGFDDFDYACPYVIDLPQNGARKVQVSPTLQATFVVILRL